MDRSKGLRRIWYRLVLALFALRPRSAILLSAGMFAAIAVADLLTPPELNLSLFYVFVILLATWNAGLIVGLTFALAASAMQCMMMSGFAPPVLHSFYWYVWLVNRLFTFFLVIALTHPLRLLFDRQQAAARIDSLTGAANHKHFLEMLNMEVLRSRRSGQPFMIVFMDCDDFKLINDQFGHVEGDAFLRGVVQAARTQTRRSDTVARLGGDEFAILLPNTTSADGRYVVERLRAKLRELKAASVWHPTLSIGVATFEGTNLAADEVLKACDSLMYRAKQAGKGRVVYQTFDAAAEKAAGLSNTLSSEVVGSAAKV